MSSLHPVQVIAVTGGKGGVGKTSVSVNLSVALAQMGRRVALLDADLGLANVDIMLGLNAKHNLEDVLAGTYSLMEIMLSGPGGIRIIPASSGTQRMSQLSALEHAGLIRAFSEISEQIDVLIIDTAAGISDSVISFVRAAQEVLVVVCDEPSSITDAYALMKLLNRDYGLSRFRVLANMTRTAQEGQNLFNKLTLVSERFLDATLQFVGSVPFDDGMRKAIQRQRAVVDMAPRSKAALAFHSLAEKVDKWPLPSSPRGHLEFFVERLVQPASVGS
jgi:flagellar biosynthesis protein FlhG